MILFVHHPFTLKRKSDTNMIKGNRVRIENTPEQIKYMKNKISV